MKGSLLKKLYQNHFFQKVSIVDIKEINTYITTFTIKKGKRFYVKDYPDYLLLVLEGNLQVIDSIEDSEYPVWTLFAREILNEALLGGRKTKPYILESLSNSTIALIPASVIKEFKTSNIKLYAQLEENTLQNFVDKMTEKESETVINLEIKNHILDKNLKNSRFIVVIMMMQSIYNLFALFFQYHMQNLQYRDFYTILIGFIYAPIIYWLIVKNKLPLDHYGLKFSQWKAHAIQGLKWSLPIVPLGGFIKWSAIQLIPAYYNTSLINFYWFETKADAGFPILFFVPLYFISCILQEFAIRSGIQSSLYPLIPPRHRTYLPIFIAAIFFSTAHIHIHPLLTLVSFLMGIFWGIMFHIQRSLVGVIVSHFFLGLAMFALLGGW